MLSMGAELAEWREWNHEATLDWELLGFPSHQGVSRVLADLNRLYVQVPALHERDFDQDGFECLDCNDAPQSVISYLRRGASGHVVVVLNFTPVVRGGYRIGVPEAGTYRELLNSDAECYAGSNVGNGGTLETRPIAWMGHPHSIELTLPPLAGLILEPVGG